MNHGLEADFQNWIENIDLAANDSVRIPLRFRDEYFYRKIDKALEGTGFDFWVYWNEVRVYRDMVGEE